MEKCWRCGKELICSGNFMLSDWGEHIDENDDAMITDYVCPYCGTEYSVTDPSIEQQKNYPYWKNRK